MADFCRSKGIRKLSVFGSLVRSDFDPSRSDVDVLVEFHPGRVPGLSYFGLGDELEPIFGRPVDVCSKLNRHVAIMVEKELLILYAET